MSSEHRSHRKRRHSPSNHGSSRSSAYRGHRSSGERGNSSVDIGRIDFGRYKSKLSKIFFGPDDLIQRDSESYRDFWRFLDRYQGMAKASNKHIDYTQTEGCVFELLPSDPSALLSRISFQDPEDRTTHYLSESILMAFRHVLTLYMDFEQQEKFRRLRQLRQSQSKLPIFEYKAQILSQLASNRVIIIAGDTGCGKSTQVPQYLLEAGYTGIACTQPRRLACIALAKRVGFETLNEYGTEIGYQIRFEKHKSEKTKVLFLTEGLLLRQVTADPSLKAYNVIVLDEVHERHLHGDFLLGVVKCLLQQRSDLKVVLMSATINIELFQSYFLNQAPLVQVPGRLYPIKLKYMPVPQLEKTTKTDKLNPAPYVRILQLIDRQYPSSERGDLLIFLSGLKEITIIVDACREYAEKESKWIVLPLHSSLALADQDKVFAYPSEGVRKCIVSTNIAETSVTIDGVRFVVDSGKVKEMHFDPVAKMQRLKETWVSRASAEQRKGRAGRTGPGVCYRLYEESEYKALSAYSTPEIHRVPLESLTLQMLSMGLPDPQCFPFIEPPSSEHLANALTALREHGAIEKSSNELTVLGQTLASLPVELSIGKMLVMACLFHQVESALSLAALLSVQSPLTNDAYTDSECVALRRNQLDSDHGDPLTLLNALRMWLEVKSDDEQARFSRKWCRKRGLEEQRLYEAIKLRQQFKQLLQDAGLLSTSSSSSSSSERAARHGELRQLRSLKRDVLRNERERRGSRRVLRVDENEEDEIDDLKDIEFRMRHDTNAVRQLLIGSRALSYRDVTLLKLILTSGLYPQLCIGDEFNGAKSVDHLLFHTRVKPFNVLHPNSIFAANPDLVILDQRDAVQLPDFKTPLSTKHQILVYLSLLETNKSYVMNSLRMPTMQTLLLFASKLDCSHDFGLFVADDWLMMSFADPHEAADNVWRASRIRFVWNKLLSMRLRANAAAGFDVDPVRYTETMERLESQLAEYLMHFMHQETLVAIKRLLPADLKIVFNVDNVTSMDNESNPFVFDNKVEHNVVVDEKTGGLRLTDYLTYNSVRGLDENIDTSKVVRAEYVCSLCDSHVGQVTPLQRLNHVVTCMQSKECFDTKIEVRHEKGSVHFNCDVCQKSLRLTPIQILKHKKAHKEEELNNSVLKEEGVKTEPIN